jgi:Flp pilus assembly protein TadG
MDTAAMRLFNRLICACASRLPSRFARRRFLANEEGAGAVDFALVLLPFLAVMMVIIESVILLLAGQVLQTSATNAARLILTGQAQTGNYTSTQFKNAICTNLTVMFNCSNNLYVDVRNYPISAIVPPPSATKSDGTLDTTSYVFSPGGPGDIVIVRLIYQWPVIAAKIGICNTATACGLVNSTTNGTNTLVATVAFRNEPYSTGP